MISFLFETCFSKAQTFVTQALSFFFSIPVIPTLKFYEKQKQKLTLRARKKIHCSADMMSKKEIPCAGYPEFSVMVLKFMHQVWERLCIGLCYEGSTSRLNPCMQCQGEKEVNFFFFSTANSSSPSLPFLLLDCTHYSSLIFAGFVLFHVLLLILVRQMSSLLEASQRKGIRTLGFSVYFFQ